MFRHVVLFRWKEGTTPAQVAAVQEALGGLPAAIPEIRAYSFGPDAGVVDGNLDFAVVADFNEADDFLAYRDHPVHRTIVEERILPHLDSRAAVQFDVDA